MIIETIELLLRGLCVGLAASITVGPVAVLVIQRTLSKGRRSAMMSGIGVACADSFMAILAYTGYSLLQTSIEQYSLILRVLGGIFVVVVGVYIFFQNPVPQIRKNRAGKGSPWQDFASMFGFTLANFIIVIPYIFAFFAMFNVGTATDGVKDFGGFMQTVLIIAGFGCGAVIWWWLLTFVINLFRNRFRPRHMLTINHTAGIVIGLLGVYTIISTFITIIPENVI